MTTTQTIRTANFGGITFDFDITADCVGNTEWAYRTSRISRLGTNDYLVCDYLSRTGSVHARTWRTAASAAVTMASELWS